MAEAAKKGNLKEMSTNDFAKHVAGHNKKLNENFCFILGAGASRSAGIPTATELMKEWREELMLRSPESRKKMAQKAGIKDKEYNHIFKKDYKAQPADYFTLFSLFFANDKFNPYNYLEKMIKCTGPSYGHYKLRDLLMLTENRFVITTNFDPLVEEALDFCGDHPLLIPHENLAGMIPEKPDKPVIIKVHRDLLYQPMNTKAEMAALKKEWKEPIARILTNYTPIVIGYAGEDNTLMSILENIMSIAENSRSALKSIIKTCFAMLSLAPADLQDTAITAITTIKNINRTPEMYWCNPNPPGEEVLQRLKNWDVYWVKDYFDNIIDYLHMEFNKQNLFGFGEKPQNIPDKIEEQARIRIEQYEATDIERTYKLVHQAFQSEKERKSIIELLENRAKNQSDRPENMYIETCILMLKGESEAALEFLGKLIEKQPEEAIYHFAKGNILGKLERYEKALESYNKAIELEPAVASAYNNRAANLADLGRFEEALSDINKALELDPMNEPYQELRDMIEEELINQQK